MAANCYRYGWVHQALVCKRSGRLLRGHAMRFVVMVRLSLRLLGFFLKFAGIPTTSPSWFDIYTVMHTFLMSTVVFSNGLHLPTKAETDIMDHIIRSFFKDKLTATYCKHNDANYPMMEYVFKSISWSSFLLESTNCGFPPQKKNINSVLHQQKTQAETKKQRKPKSATIISSIPTWLHRNPHHPPTAAPLALLLRLWLSGVLCQLFLSRSQVISCEKWDFWTVPVFF